MSEHLVIRLQPGIEDAASWLVVTSQGRRLGEPGRGTLSDAAALAGGRRVSVLLPGTDILLCDTHLPVRNPAKLLRALPFTLEEQLAQDIDSLHFAASRPDSTGHLRAAVLTRQQMTDTLARLQAAGLQADALYADTEAVPNNPGSLTLLLDGSRVYLAPPEGPPRVLDGPDLRATLELAGETFTGRHLLVYGDAHQAAALQAECAVLREAGYEVDLHLHEDGGLSRMALGVVAAPAINLLQGPFARRRSHAALWGPWRVAASLLLAFAVVSILGKAIEYQRLASELRTLDAAIDESFRRSFGDIPIADYQLQARQQLARLRGGGGGEELLLGLDALSQGLVRTEGSTRILALSYRRGTLDLRVRSPDVATLDRLQRELVEAGAGHAEIQAANPVDGGVEGRLQLRMGGGA
ncbi:MAG: hypothetical protein JJT93_05305 [Gammaproteobacteria bacterium]|nr:hypothetical protein [Gammaproteobacteria bacterium]TVQ46048.1 MAG: hypothetical protein EA371_11035 [Gammaproteobacteria bacterium]